MSFEAYLNNIKQKTGKTPEDFRDSASAAGLLQTGTTATQIIEWLAKDYDLGRGHAMCIYTVFKHESWIAPKPKKGHKPK